MSPPTTPLRHVAEVRVSNVDKKSVNGEMPVRLCNYTDVYYGDLLRQDKAYMPATATPEQVKRFRLQVGDSVITKDSETADDIAVAAYVSETAPDFVCGYHLAVLRPRSDVLHPRYLAWALRSDFCREQFSVAATGVTRFGLKYESMLGVEVPTPEFSTQQRVADFLDDQVARIDEVIRLRHEQVPNIEARRSSYLEHTMRREGSEVRLRALLARPMDYGANAAAEFDNPEWVRYIRTTDVTADGNLRSETFRSLPPEVAAPYLLADGDLLFTRSGATVGKSFLYRASWGRAAFAGYLIRARFRPDRVHPAWVRYFCDTPYYWSQITESAIQATIQNVNAEKYSNLTLPVPGLEVQKRLLREFDERAAADRAAQTEMRAQVRLLHERKRSLITAAVTGEFDVSAASGRGVA